MSADDRIYMGLDPGMKGALACIDEAGDYVDAIDLAVATLAEAADFVREYGPRSLAALESVSPGPAMGRGSAMKLGRAEGELRGLLVALQVRHQLVAPSAWQGALGCRTKGDKRVTLRVAQARWPHVHMTHTGKAQLADALLIAEWCRRFA
jgi:hypothetical protein